MLKIVHDNIGPKGEETMKIRYSEEYNIFSLVESLRITQGEKEALKGLLRLVLVAQKLLLGAI